MIDAQGPGEQPSRQWASYLAPLVLASVALLQLHLACARDLSPWKAGGFGMFSTVDAPSARFVRVYLVGGSLTQPVAVALPPELRRDGRLLRTLPTPPAAGQLLSRLAAMRWRWTTPSSAADEYHALQGLERAAPSLVGSCRDSVSPRAGTCLAVPTADPHVSEADEIAFDAVRLEVWRYRFGAADWGALVAERIFEATEKQRATRPWTTEEVSPSS